MKRQQAFSDKNGKFLKGGLHCHTNRSDGQFSPKEVLEYAGSQGYDFMALTDHQIYNFKNYAPESGVLVIPGMEYSNLLEKDHGVRFFHTVCLGAAKEDGNGFEQDQRFDEGRYPDSETYQEFLDEMHRNKNLTILCHPQWSSTSARYFENQKGNFAMEIYNSTSDIEYEIDNDAAYWDEILGQGKVWYGVATDDAHFYNALCKGWVMVKAEKNISAILKALENGEFYSSTGPEIYDFYVEDGKAAIECSPAKKVYLYGDKHPAVVKKYDQPVTRAEIDIKNSWAGEYPYVRMAVADENGKKAWTNPIFL